METLEVNMYVRTKYNGICKIEGFASTLTDDYIENEKGSMIPKDEILKASHNIIDLIEVGDYVNGSEVVFKDFNNLNEECLECGIGDYIVCSYEAKDIKTIVTKEQFEAMAYKVV